MVPIPPYMEGTRFHSIDVGGGSLVWLVFGRKNLQWKISKRPTGEETPRLRFFFFFGRLDTVWGLQGPRRIKLGSRLKNQPGWWTYSWNIFSVWCWGLMIQWYLLSCVFFLRDVLDSLNSEKNTPRTKDNSEKVWHETQRYLWKDDLPFHFVLNTEVPTMDIVH